MSPSIAEESFASFNRPHKKRQGHTAGGRQGQGRWWSRGGSPGFNHTAVPDKRKPEACA